MKILSIWTGKLAIWATRISGFGGGTTLPGYLAEKIDPKIVKKLAGLVKYGSIVITGTNGKTTVSKMLAEILTEDGYRVLYTPSGSNLSRGVASSLVGSAGIFGQSLDCDIAIFEVDEATMPEVMKKIQPRVALVTNLFRDQLDRYGELDKTAEIIGKSLRGFSRMTTVLNADDPLVASLSEYAEGEVRFFGLDDKNIIAKSRSAMDSKDCISCGHELNYRSRYFGHLGDWRCENCATSRPRPDFSVQNISLSPRKSSFDLVLPKDKLSVKMLIPGLYNVYNALAATAASVEVDSAGAPVVAALRNFSAAFGRMEEITVGDKKLRLILVKNPTGANQALEAIYTDDAHKKILFALNDNFADGTDVSWIWDIDFESLDLSKTEVVTSGIRCADASLRLKYAGVKENKIKTEEDLIQATESLAERIQKDEEGYIFATYTAMIEIRAHFAENKDSLSGLGKVTKHGI